jgi:L(+)-tartrate dehydratase beta subunit
LKRILTTPLETGSIEDLRIGDIVYLSGTLVTGRDDVHRRVVREGVYCPVDFNGIGIMHAGPIVLEEPGKNTVISIGPTSSIRMEDDAADFMRLTGVKIMIGKGGMGSKTSAGCRQYGAIHTVFPGGCAVSAVSCVEKIENVFWRELGMPECLWVMRVKEFGPLVVSIDTEGGNLFAENKAYYVSRKETCMTPIIESVKNYMNAD